MELTEFKHTDLLADGLTTGVSVVATELVTVETLYLLKIQFLKSLLDSKVQMILMMVAEVAELVLSTQLTTTR
jgi:hypothetical protein